MVRFQLYFCIILILAASVTHCNAASFQFVNIVDTAGPFKAGFGQPAINNPGTVAFHAEFDVGGGGIFTGIGGAVTTLYDSSGPFSSFGYPDINDGGTVAFSASLDAGGSGVFTGIGGPTTTITTGSSSNNPRINNQGAVAFSTGSTASPAIYVGSGGPLTTIADTSGLLSGNLNVWSFNDSSTVGFSAFHHDLAGPGDGIFAGSGGPLTIVALSGDNQPYALVQNVQLNNAGIVAFEAVLHELGNSVDVIFVGSPDSLSMVVDDYGPFQWFEPSIGLNNNGQVVFKASLDGGGEGLFTGPDPLADKVIQIGDPLFGSTVTFLTFNGALNDKGEIAFGYDLANGIAGIAVARPVPEPATLVLCVISVFAVRLLPARPQLNNCRCLAAA